MWNSMLIIINYNFLYLFVYYKLHFIIYKNQHQIKKHKQRSNLPIEVEKSPSLYRDSIGILQFHM